jgi:hypothetical protein
LQREANSERVLAPPLPVRFAEAANPDQERFLTVVASFALAI